MRTEIRKDGNDIAVGHGLHRLTVGAHHLDLPAVKSLELVYFSMVTLSPVVTFEHLAGTALSHFFDRCVMASAVRDDVPLGSESGPFRYVHGRSEVMKGNHSVSSVLLAKPDLEHPISEPQWLSYLPEIYKHFLAVYDPTNKTA